MKNILIAAIVIPTTLILLPFLLILSLMFAIGAAVGGSGLATTGNTCSIVSSNMVADELGDEAIQKMRENGVDIVEHINEYNAKRLEEGGVGSGCSTICTPLPDDWPKDAEAPEGYCREGLLFDKTPFYQITGQFGAAPGDYILPRYHRGTDIDCDNTFQHIYTPIGGKVILAVDGHASGGIGVEGNVWPAGEVQIQSEDGAVWRYYHGRNALVTVGEIVNAGQAVLECANTGTSFGSHLHFEVDVSKSTNTALKDLPGSKNAIRLGLELRDPIMALATLGIDVCPPYVEWYNTQLYGKPNPKSLYNVSPGEFMPPLPMKCWPNG